MPLVDNEYTRAKGGYKILQYWAAGVATVASPVGFNAQLIDPGIDGLLASGTAEWTQALQSLVEDPDRRCRLAAAGRAKVEREYSLATSATRLADVLDRVSSGE
jgi:glycosyltransferase involved in cell wall biosynthesis